MAGNTAPYFAGAVGGACLGAGAGRRRALAVFRYRHSGGGGKA